MLTIYYTLNNIFEITICFFYFLFIEFLLINFLDEKCPKTRWYFIHFITNSLIVSNTYNNVYLSLIEPKNIMNVPFYTFNINLVISLHLFHIYKSNKNLSLTDWLHHLISCIFVCTISLYIIHNSIIDYMLFFMCGLPGGIDYLLLYLTKKKIIYRITEKRINVNLNMWIRVPGILYGNFLSYFIMDFNKVNFFNKLIFLLIIFLNIFNSIYFAISVVKNYGQNLMKDTEKNISDKFQHIIKKSVSLPDLKKFKFK
jgi:hypothetical protein